MSETAPAVDASPPSLSLREQHEAFVSGHTGSTLHEVGMTVALAVPLSLLLVHAVARWTSPASNTKSPSMLRVGSFPLEFLVVAGPQLVALCPDVADSLPLVLLAGLATVLMAAWLAKSLFFSSSTSTDNKKVSTKTKTSSSSSSPSKDSSEQNEQDAHHLRWLNDKRRPVIEFYRGGLLLLTCLAILAVDFTVFPRRHAKTETFGISVMDAGVGAFILSAGMVSPQAAAEEDGSSRSAPRKPFLAIVKSALPMIVLGGARFVTVKASDYHEHVSEYGVHWNFFMTLAVVSLAVPLLSVPPKWSLAAGAAVMIIHETVLTYGGAADFILNADRGSSFFAANREGIISSVGYVALFLLGSGIGRILRTTRSLGDWKMLISVMWQLQVALWFASHILDSVWAPYSRRMVNITYAVGSLALTVQALALIGTICVALPPIEIEIIRAVNFNGLVAFLGANLLTGAVNLSMHTIHASDAMAFSVLTAYLGIVIGIATLLFRRKLLLKFW